AVELRYPVTEAARALRDGECAFLAGSAHAPLYAFPEWAGDRLLAALSQGTYWVLVVHPRLGLARGARSGLRAVRVGAAPAADLAVRQLLRDAGVDPEQRRIEIAPVPGTGGPTVAFGLTAAEALAAGRIDGFWANGMGARIALERGTGTLLVDARERKSTRLNSSHVKSSY